MPSPLLRGLIKNALSYISDMKKFLILPLLALFFLGVGCNDADIASQNLSTAADNFEINRRVVFYNGITGEYMLEIDGLCSLGNDRTASEISITCKTAPGQYKKHFLGLSDNVTYFMEQIDSADVSKAQYRVIFKPSIIIPDVDLR